jgi:glutamate racemase
VTGSSIELVDSGEAIAHWLKKDMDSGRLKPAPADPRRIDILTTDYSAHFMEIAHRILRPVLASDFRVVDL